MDSYKPATSPHPAPDTAFTDEAGRPVTFADFRGRLILVNFWATWCAPCVQEMPSLDRIQAKMGGADFVVLAISQDLGGVPQVEEFYAAHGIEHLDVYLDRKGALLRAFEGRGLPTTVLIGPEGRTLGRLEGAAAWDSAEAEALLRHYLGQTEG